MIKAASAVFLFFLLYTLPVDAAEIGKRAPAFTLKDENGNIVTLADQNGKVLFLNFWAPWCRACREEFPSLETLYRKYRSEGLEIIAVAVDGSGKSLSGVRREFPLTITLLLDQRGQAAEAYRLSNVPTGFIIGRDGFIRHIHKGFGKDSVSLFEKEIVELLKQ